ncbi:uncharacterized protein Bfra_011787 [Botrytis fragariae]|uniref:Uncharacterized protein n=1 Tax=Botrytis fragariae TaxID=1964551 RepID=A0A8H6AKU5_9HELO|nr:uncharacterized protein Bfra_011787 [Botrytis fragariae]KAF5869244.1 hypothetical protein Bfra_011787 [Botrytis fragariae]
MIGVIFAKIESAKALAFKDSPVTPFNAFGCLTRSSYNAFLPSCLSKSYSNFVFLLQTNTKNLSFEILFSVIQTYSY